MAKIIAKKHYVEVKVKIVRMDEDVLTTSGIDGVYDNFEDWGGLDDIW